MVKVWNNVINYGVGIAESHYDVRNIRLMNVMGILLSVILLGFCIAVLTYFRIPGMLPIILGGLVLGVLYFIMLTRVPLWITKTFFCLLPTAFATLISIVGVGYGGIDKYYLIICSVLPLIMFNRKAYYMPIILIIVGCFFLSRNLQNSVEPWFRLSEDQLVFYSTFNAVAIFTLLYLFLKMFKNEIITYQDEVENQKNLIEEKQEEIVDSIKYAKRIQLAILPSDTKVKSIICDSFIFYKPKDIVAGDFYWVEETENFKYIAAADCTGHGVPGAMVSVICSTALKRSVLEFKLIEPGEILSKTKKLVVDTFKESESEVKDGMDIGLLAINKISGEIKYAGANNPLWHVNLEGELAEVKGDKQAVGQDHSDKAFKTSSIKVSQGEMIYLMSDGFQDQFGGDKGKKYKPARLKKFLSSIASDDFGIQHKKLEVEFDTWKGKLEQLDDVCLIGIRT